MRKSLFVVVAAVVVVTALLGSSLVARSQAAARFEYTKLTPFSELIPGSRGGQIWATVGYKACVATVTEWSCRDFRSENSADAGFRIALATLGRDGWELVAPYPDSPEVFRSTLMFKRALQ